MTPDTERWLRHVAAKARDYIARKNRGESDRGQYEGLLLAEELTKVLAQVDTEQQGHAA